MTPVTDLLMLTSSRSSMWWLYCMLFIPWCCRVYLHCTLPSGWAGSTYVHGVNSDTANPKINVAMPLLSRMRFKSKPANLYILMIDSLSRAGFHRSFPSFVRRLSADPDLEVFEHFRYSSTAWGTVDNTGLTYPQVTYPHNTTQATPHTTTQGTPHNTAHSGNHLIGDWLIGHCSTVL